MTSCSDETCYGWHQQNSHCACMECGKNNLFFRFYFVFNPLIIFVIKGSAVWKWKDGKCYPLFVNCDWKYEMLCEYYAQFCCLHVFCCTPLDDVNNRYNDKLDVIRIAMDGTAANDEAIPLWLVILLLLYFCFSIFIFCMQWQLLQFLCMFLCISRVSLKLFKICLLLLLPRRVYSYAWYVLRSERRREAVLHLD